MVNFVTVKVDYDKCNFCLDCIDSCQMGALTIEKNIFIHNAYECANCEVCMDVCDVEAIEILDM